MKRTILFTGLVLSLGILKAQVGIGTLSPNTKSLLDLTSNTKGLLLPRFTAAEKSTLGSQMSASETGMMIFQTSSPGKGIYSWDGSAWINHSMLDPGSSTSTTLRWDNTNGKWIPASNFYNGGGSIGVNMGGNAPNYQLHVHSTGPNFTRMQITAAATGVSQSDGLLIGIGNTTTPGVAHILQQENKPLWIGTNGLERMRIDSAGRVGINQSSPAATLDVNGTLKVGANGSTINSIMKMDIEVDPPILQTGEEWSAWVPCANTTADAVVYVSPSAALSHMVITYSRVSSPGTIEVKFMSMVNYNDLGPLTLHIAIIQ